MDVWEADKIVLFLAFVVPGFISIKLYQLIFPGCEKSTSDKLIDMASYSSINYALMILPIFLVERFLPKESSPSVYLFFYIFVVFVSPVVWVLLWKLIRTRSFFQKHMPHPVNKPWDYVFRQRKSYWVKANLKNGAVIGGLYAGNSFASSAPAVEQIYLEETWILNERGAFERAKNRTAGVIIFPDEISYLELRKME